MIYLDYGATAPMTEAARQTYLQTAQQYFANPSSIHTAGVQAAGLLAHCRQQLAQLCGCRKEELVFTSGGSEGNHLALTLSLQKLRGLRQSVTKQDGGAAALWEKEFPTVARKQKNDLKSQKHSHESNASLLTTVAESRGCHNRAKIPVLVNPLEHGSIWQWLKGYEADLIVKKIPLTAAGRVDICETAQLLAQTTVENGNGLVICQQVNSLTGMIQPVEKLAELTMTQDWLFHSDCVQGFGKLVGEWPHGITSWCASGHKIGGPKGTGILYLAANAGFTPLLPDIHQEYGFRSGTEDLPGIAAFTQAAVDSFSQRQELDKRFQDFRQSFMSCLPDWQIIGEICGKVELTTDPIGNCKTVEKSASSITGTFEGCYPGVWGILSPRLAGETVVMQLSAAGIACSTTSACNTHRKIDPALFPLGLDQSAAQRFLRISLGPATTKAEIETLIRVLSEIG